MMDRFVVKQKRNSDKQPSQTRPVEKEDEGETSGQQGDCEGQVTKKRKVQAIQDEHRKYQEKWTEEFAFVLHDTNSLCLICQKVCSGFKRGNLERHLKTTHPNFNKTYPPGSSMRKNKIERLTALIVGQQKLIHRSTSTAENLTEASFEIAWILAKHKKAFTDAEIIKGCFLASSEIMYADFNNKDEIIKQIRGLQLSDTTVMRRVEELGKDIRGQLIADLSAAPCFSIALDESTDVCDVAQVCVWARFPKEDSFREELLCLLPLQGQTRGEDILSAFLFFFHENNLNWSNLASVCTDGAPNMKGKEKGVVGLMRKREEIPNFATFHYIIHQEALVAKLKKL